MKEVNKFKELHVTMKDLENRGNVVRYRINGRIYTFIVTDTDDPNILYGYCKSIKKWAWLYPNYVFFKEEYPIEAEKI